MTQLINAQSTGIPLYVLTTEEYDIWLGKQSAAAQAWLANTGFQGKGVATLPDESGSLAAAVMVVANASEYFACGDLVNKLPAGQYLLVTDDANKSAVAFGWCVGGYRFDRYLSRSEGKTLPVLAIADQALADEANKLSEATALVRDLINTPAADMMPQHLAQTCQALADEFGASFSEIVGDDLLTENYPTIHAVGRASCHAPRLLDLRWGDSKAPKVTLVGKGVCFDSGGLDVKPASGMRLMKKDMGGAAHVLGLARMIMAFGLNIQLRVMIPAVENAIAGNAFRPGDVITTRTGLNVEIDNTDAEGRLVLCDALADAADEKPELIIDFATLTGAMRVALGTELPGFFATNDETANGISKAGEGVQDPVWRMPLHQAYRDMLNSDIADMTNCANGPFGGAITAALYLQEFLPQESDWCHFDVMAYNVRALPGRPKGGEAFGIRAVFGYLQTRFG
ncbi:leucyl aminopeptidase family protein [Thalassotalea euphylliae]|uniref:Leucyl aminopeptidase family protein n=1 Tax=Thalassotalea euphylliae TaxID=1655234 RepID=A0A3E0TPH8_9GAMM|nr:leucyl aminopeptidase family protein [Thalassotalea euphylliae]REL26257.1 leucyl aminopeptidase family protein [Thalassotalea euphylliae]